MNWRTNLEQAKEESQKTRKPILLQFEMDGCGGCKKMNATLYEASHCKRYYCKLT